MSKDKRVHKFATFGLWKSKTKNFPKQRFSTFGIFTEYTDYIMSHIWPIWMSNWGISLECVAVHCSWFDSNYHIEAQKTQQSPFYCYMKKIIFFDLFVILPFMVISKVDKQYQQGTKMIICFFSNISQYQWKNKRRSSTKPVELTSGLFYWQKFVWRFICSQGTFKQESHLKIPDYLGFSMACAQSVGVQVKLEEEGHQRASTHTSCSKASFRATLSIVNVNVNMRAGT